MCKGLRFLTLRIGVLVIVSVVCGTVSASSARVSLLPGLGDSKWLAQFQLQGFTPGSPVHISASGMRAGGRDEALTPFRWSFDHASGNIADDGTFAIRFKQSDWGSFTFDARDEQGNQAQATLVYDFDGNVLGGGTPPPPGEWDYLARLMRTSGIGIGWERLPVNFEGLAYANSYKGGYLQRSAIVLPDLKRPGKPRLMTAILGVSDETRPEAVYQFQIRLDDRPPLEYQVRLRQHQEVSLNVAGVGRVDITVIKLTAYYGKDTPVIVEPKIYY